MADAVEVKKSVPVVADVDVLVVGAGIGGCTAAVVAAREGARTLVVDRFGFPGGNMGPGMSGGAPDLELPPVFADGMPGVPGEFVRRCESYGNAPLLNHYFRDAQAISYVWLKMMEEAGVELMLNTYAADPIMDGNRVTGLTVENKNGTRAIRARVVVDATGDADVAARAGAPMDDGTSMFSPGVYFAMANVDIETYVSSVFEQEPDPEDVRWMEGVDERLPRRMKYLRPLAPFFRAAWESGEYRFLQPVGDLGDLLLDHGIFRSVSGVQHVADPLRKGRYGILGALLGFWRRSGLTSGDTAVMTAIEVAARKFIFETVQFLIRRVPGFGEAYLHMIAPYFNSRGGCSFISEYPLTPDDLRELRRHDDVVFRCITHGIADRPDAPVEYVADFDFPLRQLIPQRIDGLLGAGRACIVQPPVLRVRWQMFLTGQAAGVAAALAARDQASPRDLNVRELQRILLEKYGVPLADEARLKDLGLT